MWAGGPASGAAWRRKNALAHRPYRSGWCAKMRAMSELKIEELAVGNGDEAMAGRSVEVHYTGWLESGQKFDSSVDRGKPFSFELGSGQVIQGWDRGVAGMKVGGRRRLTIPPDLGYGARGAAGVIPPNAILIFEVELLGVG